MKKRQNFQKGVIAIALIVAIILYLAGVFSGLYASRVIREETQANLTSLRAYVGVLEESVKTQQLEQGFANTLDTKNQCQFSELSMNNLFTQLRGYWEELPFRIEEYEKSNTVSKELKLQYTTATLQTWITAKGVYSKCNTTLIPVLYFYSKNCSNCVEQGRQLDEVQRIVANESGKAIVFTIDIGAPEPMINRLVNYYNITKTPAVIINDKVSQGKVFDAQTLASEVRRRK